jgi:hypothetical protein
MRQAFLLCCALTDKYLKLITPNLNAAISAIARLQYHWGLKPSLEMACFSPRSPLVAACVLLLFASAPAPITIALARRVTQHGAATAPTAHRRVFSFAGGTVGDVGQLFSKFDARHFEA